MPRPRKCRKVCCMPAIRRFEPVSSGDPEKSVVLTVDEYETIRLIDQQGFSQEECSAFMKVARTTVQQIYNTARKKLANVLVDGLALEIKGGSYQLCDGKEHHCGCGGCSRHRRGCLAEPVCQGEPACCASGWKCPAEPAQGGDQA